MTDAAPDWDLLADDPAMFFDLGLDWDRRDLRRAYGRWIKRFKPDAHPDEFRKIRAGFERLEDELRFQRMDDGPGAPGRAEKPKPTQREEPRETEDTRPEQSTLIASVATRGAAAVLRELREDFPLWWVPSYLALFMDGDEAASDEVFERQLVAALTQRPREPILLNLMRSWVRRRSSAGDGLKLLHALRSLPDMTLAAAATPLLKQLAAAGHSEALEAELRRLERALDVEGRAAFAAVLEDCLLAAAMVLDPSEVDRWLDEVALDRHGRFDVDEAHAEAASRILQWRRKKMSAALPEEAGITRELEVTLMQLAVGDEATRLDALVTLGQRIRSASDEIYGCLQPYHDATYALVQGLSIFGLPFDDGSRLSEAEHMGALEGAQVFLVEMNERTEGSVLARLWTLLPLMGWTFTAVFFGSLVGPLTAAFEAFRPVGEPLVEAGNGLGWLARLIGVCITVVVQFIRRGQDEPLWVVTRALRWTEKWVSLFLYRTIWRRRLLEFGALQPWSGQQLVSVLRELQQGDGSTVAEEIVEHLAEDPALLLILFGRDLEA